LEHFFDWFERQSGPGRPWLILGKGPTFALRDRYELRDYHLLSLNHAVREQPVLLAHMIDLDVVDACGDALLQQARYVVLPWYPHAENAAGTRSLEQVVPTHPILRRLADEGRLLWYDLSTAPRRHGPGPVVQATYFSAEAAVSLLALAGVRRVRSLGVDGGSGYSTDFDDLTDRTLLANGQPGFDLQFGGIARTILHTGVDFAPLDQPAPIMVHAATAEGSSLPDRVLEFSVRKHTSMSVRVQWIRSPGESGTGAADVTDAAGTWNPGELRRAIALRSGALVLDDLRRLWARPLEREVVEVPRRSGTGGTAVSPAIAVVTASDARSLATLIRGAEPGHAVPVAATLPASWNRCDHFEEGDTSLLCYATPGLQPWISRAHPFGHLWVATLIEAVETGFVTLDQIRSDVRQGHVRPSLLEQVERGDPESLLVSWSARRRDAEFTPPSGASPKVPGLLEDSLLVLRALARHARRQVGVYRRRRTA
jgi:hypothetical protein